MHDMCLEHFCFEAVQKVEAYVMILNFIQFSTYFQNSFALALIL